MRQIQPVWQLDQNHHWKFRSHGVVILFRKDQPLCCFIMESWNRSDLEALTAQLTEAKGHDTDPNGAASGDAGTIEAKLVGHSDFISALLKWCKRSELKVRKAIVRDVPFEMIYLAGTKEFKVTIKEEPKVAPGATPRKKIKVLIVDDSSTIRKVLASICEQDPTIEVLGALERPSLVEPFIEKNRPDVMTLDIHMPEMDGVTLLKKIQSKHPIPTVMISSLTREDGPYVFDALANGAFDYIQKPSFQDIPILAPTILERIHLASTSKVQRAKAEPVARPTSEKWRQDHMILIGSSTGGTDAVARLFRQFPDQIPPVLVVQHIPPVFSKAFADRLNSSSNFLVKEAEDGDLVEPNKVLIAPGGKQMGLAETSGGKVCVHITDDAPVNRHKPSVDYLFFSAVKLQSTKVVGIILTGMGADGARGLKALRDLGCHTIGQDEASCVVYGMPKSAAEMGAVEIVSPLEEMGQRISRILKTL
ncbi:MAG: chemotaxis response regulator protein-glutamate methylesterase [Bdellovibrio sp.]|nr:MAG: chemotaxis response regulator protein-glutamate methylesterase [Bdellovibrio sp.]